MSAQTYLPAGGLASASPPPWDTQPHPRRQDGKVSPSPTHSQRARGDRLFLSHGHGPPLTPPGKPAAPGPCWPLSPPPASRRWWPRVGPAGHLQQHVPRRGVSALSRTAPPRPQSAQTLHAVGCPHLPLGCERGVPTFPGVKEMQDGRWKPGGHGPPTRPGQLPGSRSCKWA